MKINPIFWADIKDGKLFIRNKQKFQEYLHSISGEFQLILKKYYKPRTDDQNGYYWALLRIISEYNGDDPKDLHFIFRCKFLIDPASELGIPRSTTDLNTAEFVEYIENIRRLMAGFGVDLPDPDGCLPPKNEYGN